MIDLSARIEALFPELCALAVEAGQAIMEIYKSDFAVRTKDDKSPLTDADLAADRIIIDGLTRLTPDIDIITEETFKGDFTIAAGVPYWEIDPLDGTAEFAARSGEFTVNLGLIGPDGRPIAGVIYVPVTGELFWGGPGIGAWKKTAEGAVTPISVRTPPIEGVTVVTSRYHGNAEKLREFLKGITVAQAYPLGSTLKFCAIAEGKADLYPHFGSGTREWDTAAGQAIVEGAGGSVQLLSGGDMPYGKIGLRNPPYLVKGLET